MSAPDALTALLDQADAATAETAGILAGVARHFGVRADAAELAPVEVAVLRRLVDRAATRQLGLCPHLSFTPGPCWWVPWAPGRLRCHHCADAVGRRILGTREQHRCDSCRRHRPPIAEVVRPLPPVVSAIPGLPVGLGPVIVVAGYCRDCHPRPTTPATGG